jgi:YihY family inner membrane protein
MNCAEAAVRRIDAFQQRHALVGFPFAVIQKFGNDQAGAKAALVAYYGLFSLFPLLLLLATVLGFVLGEHPGLQHRVINSALADFPIIGTQLRSSTHSLRGSGAALAVGVAGTVYGTQGVAGAVQNAMNSIWNVPFKTWPGFVGRRVRGFLILAVLGTATLASTALAGFVTGAVHGAWARVGTIAASTAVNLGVYFAAFLVLTAESLGWRDVAVGAVLATVFWEVLQALGGFYVRHALAHASEVYGFFAIVIGLLSWLYLGAQLTLLAAEIDVVLRYRLWPRSMTQPPFTAQDKATFVRLAKMEERRPEEVVSIEFTAEADRQPPGAGPVP